MKIRTIRLSHLRNEEHLGLHLEVLEILRTTGESVIARVHTDGYERHCVALNEVVETILKSVITEQLVKADKERIALFRGLRDQLKGNLHHFGTAQRKAAIRVHNVMQHHREIPEKPQCERSGALLLLLGLLHGEYAADMAVLGLTEWVHELEKSARNYEILLEARFAEHAARPSLKVTNARKTTDNYYRALIDHINALVLLAPETEGLAELIKAINLRVTKYHQIITQRQGMQASLREKNSLPHAGTGMALPQTEPLPVEDYGSVHTVEESPGHPSSSEWLPRLSGYPSNSAINSRHPSSRRLRTCSKSSVPP